MPKKRYSYIVEQGTSKLDAGFWRDDTFDSIATEVGATAVTDADLKNVIMKADISDLPLPVITFTYEVAGKIKSSYAHFSTDKTPNAVAAGLIGKTFNGGTINGIGYPKP